VIAFNAPSVRTPPGYSHAVRAGGLLFISGQVPLDEAGDIVGADMQSQAHQAFQNLATVLATAGVTFDAVVKLTYFVTDISQVPAIRAARDDFVNPDNPPASTLVEVSRLYLPGLLIEVEAVAEITS
jgi:reactive intermediate/imine deaminase